MRPCQAVHAVLKVIQVVDPKASTSYAQRVHASTAGPVFDHLFEVCCIQRKSQLISGRQVAWPSLANDTKLFQKSIPGSRQEKGIRRSKGPHRTPQAHALVSLAEVADERQRFRLPSPFPLLRYKRRKMPLAGSIKFRNHYSQAWMVS